MNASALRRHIVQTMRLVVFLTFQCRDALAAKALERVRQLRARLEAMRMIGRAAGVPV